MMTEKEIYERLVPLLVEVLGVTPQAIRRESVLVADLGAESIDLLDLSFRVEDTFKVTLEANELENDARLRLPGGEYERAGLLTEEALAELRVLLPDVDPNKLRPGLRKTEEVAELVAFLASNRASYINAQAIHIDGGI